MSGSRWPAREVWTGSVAWDPDNIYNNPRERGMNMSSMVLCVTKEEAILASDSRMIFNKEKVFDTMPKVTPYKNGLIGIVGLSYYKDVFFGENLEGGNVFEAAKYLTEKMQNLPIASEIVAIEYNGSIRCTITETSEDVTYPFTGDWRIFGVKHSVDYDKISNRHISPRTCRTLIKADEECEKILKNIPAVGGPIQMYRISRKGIENLSDKDAPVDFKKIKEEINRIQKPY